MVFLRAINDIAFIDRFEVRIFVNINLSPLCYVAIDSS